jgi:hypothetical protein
MKKLIFSLLFIFVIVFGVKTQVYKTVNVALPGNLSALLTQNEITTTTNLTITGNINAADIQVMRDQMSSLQFINLTESNIEGNVLPSNSFYNSTTNSGKITLLRIKLPESITHIGNNAFRGCANIDSVLIPNSVTTIGDYSFYKCLNLKYVRFPNKLQEIRTYSFCGTQIQKVNLTDTKTEKILESAFQSCSSIIELCLNEGVDSIGTCAFLNCTKIPELIFPTTIKVIGQSSFSGCENARKIFFNTNPNSRTSIKKEAFYNCINVKDTLIIPSSIIEIQSASWPIYGAFYNCNKIPYVVFQNGITSIGATAFMKCSGIKGELFFPATLTDIKNDAFNECTNINKIYFNENLTNLGAKAFYKCSGLRGTLNLPNSITNIGYACFTDCSNLTNVEIPSSVSKLDELSLNCLSFSSIKTLNPTPISLTVNPFRDIDKSACYLYVPYGSKVSYSNSIYWKDFLNIVEYELPNTPKKYYVNVICNENGRVNKSGLFLPNNSYILVNKDDSIQLELYPNSDCIVDSVLFNNYYVNDKIVFNNNTYKYTTPLINSASTIYIKFKKKPYLLSLVDSENGCFGIEVEQNSKYKITIQPSENWEIYNILYNNINILTEITNNIYLTPSINENSILNVIYKQKTYTVTNEIKSKCDIKFITNDRLLSIENIPINKRISIYDINGKCIKDLETDKSTMNIILDRKKIYIIKVENDTFKVILP